MLSEKCCLSRVFPLYCTASLESRAAEFGESLLCVDQSDTLVAKTHTHRQTDRRVCLPLYISKISSRLICLICLHTKGRRRSSQCLKRTLLLASMTNLFTTVVMLSVFMSISIVLIFCCYLLLAFVFKYEKTSVFFFFTVLNKLFSPPPPCPPKGCFR